MFTIYSESDAGFTLVPNAFIDDYMSDANDAQLKIYLYLLRTMRSGGSTCICDIADQFNHTEREVLRSLRYWEKRGILTLEYEGDGEVSGIRLKELRPCGDPAEFSRGSAEEGGDAAAGDTGHDGKHPDVPPRGAGNETGHADRGIQGLTLPSHREGNDSQDSRSYAGASVQEASREAAVSQHRPDEAQLEEFRSNRKRAQLLFVIEQYIGKPLSPGEVQSVCYISEELHFSDALIDYLMQYCIDRGKKDFRYIEKVAVNWAENGITTPRQAERAVSPLRKKRRGQGGVRPSMNKFNQFEQNHYDFEELEREILGS